MIMSLLSLLGGGLLRILPELIGLWNKKADNSHELALMDKQIELQKLKGADDRALVIEQSNANLALGEQTNNAAEVLAMLDAQKSALQSQMQKIGIWWVDAMNFLVRPVTTYYFLGFHFIAKVCMIVVAFQSGSNDSMWKNISGVYGAEDAAILSGILSFWFVGRVFDKKK